MRLQQTVQILLDVFGHLLRRVHLCKFQPVLLAVFLPERIAQSLPQHHAGKLLRDHIEILFGGDSHFCAPLLDIASHFLVFFVVFPLSGQLCVHLFLRNGKAALLRLIEHDEVQQELIQRILLRGKDSGRADDASEEVIRGRLDVYRQQTAVVSDYYAAQGKYASVNGTGSMEEVFSRITDVIDQLQ